MNYTQSEQILAEIKRAKNILLNCHPTPDGDTVSSALAMRKVLTNFGLNISIVCPDILPEEYAFLPFSGKITQTDFTNFDYSKFDLFVVMDTSTWDRVVGSKELSQPEIPVIKIDHHASGEDFGKINLLDIKASATCEILAKLFLDWEVDFDETLSTYLLCGILTDTGSFQFEVTPQTLRLAADLMENGAKREEIRLNLFRNMDFENSKYLAKLFNNLKIEKDGGFMWTALKHEEVGEYGELIDTYLLDLFLQSTKDTDFGMRIIEKEKGVVSISFRSRTGFDTGRLAKELGGGGHVFAAGATITTDNFEQTVLDLIEKVKKYVAVVK